MAQRRQGDVACERRDRHVRPSPRVPATDDTSPTAAPRGRPVAPLGEPGRPFTLSPRSPLGIGEVDALPGPEHVKRVGDDDVQAALETIATGGTAETPLGETIDAGTEEAHAA
jgi:hypothetical protein